MIRRLLSIAAIAILPAFAWAQGVPLQGGPWTPGHVPQYVGQGSSQPVISDGGSAAGGAIGANASEIGIVARGTGTAPYSGQGSGAFGSIGCLYDAPTNNATGYHFLCLSPNATTGNGLISYGAGGTATPGLLQFNINGSTYAFPPSGSGTGNVNGPVSSTVGHIATWNNASGTLLADTTQIALANLPTIGANTVLGSIAGGTPIALTTTQLTTLCNAFTSSLSGCVPLSGGGTANFLRADGAWAPATSLVIGTTPITSGTTQQLLFDSAGLVGEVTKCNSGTYLTDGSGNVSCGQTLPSAVQGNITAVGTVASGNWQGSPVAGLYGGTGLSTAAIGDIMYASATTPTWARLADVATGSVLVSGGVSTAPSWSASPSVTAITVANNVTIGTAANTLVLKRGSNGAVGTFTCTSGGSITVSNTNVAVTDTIIISLNTAGGTQSTAPNLNAITASTSFVAKCATSDTGVYNYAIIKNAA